MLSALGYRVRIGTVYVISLDSGVGIHLKSRRHRIAHSTQRGPALPTEGPAPRGNMTMADTEKVASGIPDSTISSKADSGRSRLSSSWARAGRVSPHSRSNS